MGIRQLLERASLGRLVPLFEEEALTVSSLVSMGGSLRANLEELGLTLDEVEAIAEALLHGEMDTEHVEEPATAREQSTLRVEQTEEPAAAHEVESTGIVLRVLAQYREHVALLQAELFAEDLEPPAGAERWSEAELRVFFESGGESCPPRVSAATASRAPEPAAVASSPAEPAEPPTAEAPTANEPRVHGPVVGTLRIRWQGHTAEFDFAADTTVVTLKQWLQHKTRVRPARQKLLGFARQPAGQGTSGGGGGGGGGSGSVDDGALLCAVQPAPGKVVTMLGTPDAELEAAELELERGRRASRLVHNDLRSASESPEAAASRGG